MEDAVSTDKKRARVTACVVTRNEEKNIRACLESVKWVEEAVVVDSLSTDRTAEICREYTERVYERRWPGHIEQKTYALGLINTEWVLFLDADERLSPELSREMQEVLERKEKYDGYLVPRKVYYLGRWITHGEWYPDYKLRLFRREGAWVGGEEPHDQVIVKGPVKRLKHPIWHFTYRDLSHQMQKMDNFAAISAGVMAAGNVRPRICHLVFHPLATFLKGYFLRRGFLDGIAGLVIAITCSYYVFLKYAKLWEKTAAHPGARGKEEREKGKTGE